MLLPRPTSSGGLADGDYGDVTVGGSGSTLTIDPASVTAAKTTITGTPTGSLFLRDDWSWQPLAHWMMQTADRTLTSTTSQQQIFNTTTNGRVTLPTGVYTFETNLYLTDMSGTGGNATFSLIGAGSATIDRVTWEAVGQDSNTPLAANTARSSASDTALGPGELGSALTGTGMFFHLIGAFRVSAAGTLVPSLGLTTAAAATVKAGTYISFLRVGESSQSYGGSWD